MDTKTLTVLEYPKILERLAANCGFSASADLARKLQPSVNLEEIQRLQAETSEVHALGVTFDSPAPGSGQGDVTSAQASAIADDVLEDAGITGMTASTPVKMAVRPNTWWQTDGTMDPLPGPAEVAWVCPYDDGQEFHEVWVDISTGTVIGGASDALAGRRNQATIRGLSGLAEAWSGSWRKEGVR